MRVSQRARKVHPVFSGLGIFLLSTAIFVGGALYVFSSLQSAKALYASGDTVIDLGISSQWFEGERSGYDCRTWFTCKKEGARLRNLYMEYNGGRYSLGSTLNNISGYDIFGHTFATEEFLSCAGSDNGVSIQLNPKTILVALNRDDHSRVEKFEYSYPAGYTDEATFILEFESSTQEIWQVYEQQAVLRSCSI